MHASIVALAAVAGCIPSVAAHGYVSGIVSAGKYYVGQSPEWYYQAENKETIPASAGWMALNQDDGYVAPTEYKDQNISCHKSAKTGKAYVTAAAGSTIDIEWNTWPTSHHGPVLNYLAACPGDCTEITAKELKFFKIEAKGLISDTTIPGTWATDELIANNYTAKVTIPSEIKSGGYVLRHEIIALHGAESVGGAQNYPQCINLKVTDGKGTTHPAGELGTKLYTEDEKGIVINIYEALKSYPIPGPAIAASLTKKVRSVFVA